MLHRFCFRSSALFTVASRNRTRAETPENHRPITRLCLRNSRRFFVVAKKSKTKSSSFSYGQAHEQTNKLMKSKSGLADVLNKEESRFLRDKKKRRVTL